VTAVHLRLAIPKSFNFKKEPRPEIANAISKTENVSVLQSQLAAVESRLQKMETDGKFAERIIQAYEPASASSTLCSLSASTLQD